MPYPFETELTVETALNGKRIDSFLVRHFRNYTSFRMQRLIRAGQIRVDGLVADANQRVYCNQRVAVRLTEPPDKLHPAENLPVDIHHEDAWMFVINKPAGQLVHPVSWCTGGTLANSMQFLLDARTEVPGLLRPGFVHRLDRFSSGIMVVAKEHNTHTSLSLQFAKGEVQKSYLAIVDGRMECMQGVIDRPIGRSSVGQTVLMSASPEARSARPARTDYVVREQFDEATLVEAYPHTGRLHQIRVHLAEMGFPIVGDQFYGAGGEIKQSREECSTERHAIAGGGTQIPGDLLLNCRHALHARSLLFRHPITTERMRFEAPLPDDMRRLLDRLRTKCRTIENAMTH